MYRIIMVFVLAAPWGLTWLLADMVSKIRLATQRPIFRERLLYLVLLVVTAYMFGYLYELFFQWVLGMTRSMPFFILAMLGGAHTTQYIVTRYNKMWA